jgi:hypothetical protein
VTQTQRAWLPNTALAHPCARAPVVRALEVWSESWLTGEALQLLHWEALAGQGRTVGQTYGGPGLWSATDLGRQRLAERVLLLSGEAESPNLAEREILSRFWERAITDLSLQVGREFVNQCGDAEARDAIGSPGVRAEFGFDPGQALLSVILPADLLVPAVRQGLPAPPLRSPPAPRRAAISDVVVGLQAILGDVEISWADFRAMGVGDVLILDRALADGVKLKLKASEAVLCAGHLSGEGSDRRLLLQPGN